MKLLKISDAPLNWILQFNQRFINHEPTGAKTIKSAFIKWLADCGRNIFVSGKLLNRPEFGWGSRKTLANPRIMTWMRWLACFDKSIDIFSLVECYQLMFYMLKSKPAKCYCLWGYYRTHGSHLQSSYSFSCIVQGDSKYVQES